MSGVFERFIGIDWSGAAKPSGQHVYVAEAHRQGGRVTVQSVTRAHDRAAVEDFLRGAGLEPAPAWRGWPGPGRLDRRSRRVVALDFAFGFPTGFEHPELGSERSRPGALGNGSWNWEDLGAWADRLDPGDGNGGRTPSVRRAIAEDPALSSQFRLRGGSRLPAGSLRTTDTRLEGLRPESVFHLIGPSQVGIGSITGIAMLHRLRGVEGLAVWPFDGPERIEAAAAVLVEVYPRMWLDRGIRKNELPERVRQFDAWRRAGVAFSAKAELAAASSGDALDAAAAAIGAARSCYSLPATDHLPAEAREREGWIAGVQV